MAISLSCLVRSDFDRLSRMLATKVRALGEVLKARNKQNTNHICSACQQETNSWLEWQMDVLSELSRQSKQPIKLIDENIKWRRGGQGGLAKIIHNPVDDDDSDNDTVVFQPKS